MKPVDIFRIHDESVRYYGDYVRSFIEVRNEEIAESISAELDQGKLWPPALIQFNPAYAEGDEVGVLQADGILHPELANNIFSQYVLHRHQTEALRLADAGKGFIVTSGTGSGKSLAFLGSIMNGLFKAQVRKPGIKAVVVYPMNALINSQEKALEEDYKGRYEKVTGRAFPLTFGKYTGQSKEDARSDIHSNPPDILLTNYMMLELLLTRGSDSTLKASLYENLRWLAFDELHTYRGRQGADVAMLIRRIRSRCSHEVLCMGTSATMVSDQLGVDRRTAIADFASTIFGVPFGTDQVVDETLRFSLSSNGGVPGKTELAASLSADWSALDIETVRRHPLGSWLEARVALDTFEPERIKRGKPRSFAEIGAALQDETGVSLPLCESALTGYLLSIGRANGALWDRDQGRAKLLLPYKIHQFISSSGSVFASLHKSKRIVTLDPAREIDRDGTVFPIFELVFSRATGGEFYCVELDRENSLLVPREFGVRWAPEDEEDEDAPKYPEHWGYIIPDPTVWDPSRDMDELPESWVKKTKDGQRRLNPDGSPMLEKKYERAIPQLISWDVDGRYSMDESLPNKGWFLREPLIFDPTAGAFFDFRTRPQTILGSLGVNGRSTSTSIISLSILDALRREGFSAEDRKLLSFTDNRQDAALQAGHFNDFVRTVLIRSALVKAIIAAGELNHASIGQALFNAVGLPESQYMARLRVDSEGNPIPPRFGTAKFQAAFRYFLEYVAVDDLSYNWKYVLPNLEQCGLLRIDYADLEDNAANYAAWRGVALADGLSAEDRITLIRATLDLFRRNYAIHSVDLFDEGKAEARRKEIEEKLSSAWRIPEKDPIWQPSYVTLSSMRPRNAGQTTSCGFRSEYGRFVRRFMEERGRPIRNGKDYDALILPFIETLRDADWIEESEIREWFNSEPRRGWRLKIDAILWKPGNGEIPNDPVRQSGYKGTKRKPNSFFARLYREFELGDKNIIAAEHTGQVKNEDRIDREARFRSGELSALYCSPTMELGVDIRELTVVHMRNVPPGPANYAQRSGRAGRSGQPALVYTSCSQRSPHDRFYQHNPIRMVSGEVAAPRLDLDNPELRRTHLHAFWLSEKAIGGLSNSVGDVIDIPADGTLDLLVNDDARSALTPSASDLPGVVSRFRAVLKGTTEDESETSEDAIAARLSAMSGAFDAAFDRWRALYREAAGQQKAAQEEIARAHLKKDTQPYRDARRMEALASSSLDQLMNKRGAGTSGGSSIGEFYPFRYLAAEGFLPGYNFTRLPVRLALEKGNAVEYLERSRSIALQEFGPENIVYHNGEKFRVSSILLPSGSLSLHGAQVALNSGYFMLDKEVGSMNVDPFTGVPLSDPSARIDYGMLVEMTESKGKPIERISCDEEDRTQEGYLVKTYFSYPKGTEHLPTQVLRSETGDELLRLRFMNACNIVTVNEAWRIGDKAEFWIDTKTGWWKRKRPDQAQRTTAGTPPAPDDFKKVRTFTQETADAIYLEPLHALDLEPDGRVSLQYALLRAVAELYQAEESEIGATLIGDPATPNILLYENAEGSLGVLSQIIHDPEAVARIAAKAWDICDFAPPETGVKASYDDLLTYYNQRDHKRINRFLIRNALELLKTLRGEVRRGGLADDYEQRYRNLAESCDPHSSTEREFLKGLYDRGLALPDAVQAEIPAIYVRPDFAYGKRVVVFCDGTPHDNPSVAASDAEKRKSLKKAGYQVLVWRYDEDLGEWLAKRPDIFRKVKA